MTVAYADTWTVGSSIAFRVLAGRSDAMTEQGNPDDILDAEEIPDVESDEVIDEPNPEDDE